MTKVVTAPMAARMKAMRAAGHTYLAISAELGVSASTVMRHTSDHHAEMQKKHDRARYRRDREKRLALSKKPCVTNQPNVD